MSYISRSYLREKFLPMKQDLEGCLDILNEDIKDEIDEEDAKRVLSTVMESSEAIIKELLNCHHE